MGTIFFDGTSQKTICSGADTVGLLAQGGILAKHAWMIVRMSFTLHQMTFCQGQSSCREIHRDNNVRHNYDFLIYDSVSRGVSLLLMFILCRPLFFVTLIFTTFSFFFYCILSESDFVHHIVASFFSDI